MNKTGKFLFCENFINSIYDSLNSRKARKCCSPDFSFFQYFPQKNFKKIPTSWYPDWLCPSDVYFRVFSLLNEIMTTSSLNTWEKINVVSLIKKNSICIYTHIYIWMLHFHKCNCSSKDDSICNRVSICILFSSFWRIFILPSLINLKVLSTPAIIISRTVFNNISLFIDIY